jgi:hypothetical protein
MAKAKPDLSLAGGKGGPTADELIAVLEKLTGKPASAADRALIKQRVAALRARQAKPKV